MDKIETNHDHWVWKRRFMFATTAFFMTVILVILLRSNETPPAQTAMWMSYLGIIANVGAYVFGASWEDIWMARAGFTRSNSTFQSSGMTSVETATQTSETVVNRSQEDEHVVR